MDQALAVEPLACGAYPILTLPNEITSEIFVHFLPVYPICPPLRGFFSPIILTHVCHQWREVALSTPALWRGIKLDSKQESAAERKELLQAWITRSRALPLSIEVFINGELPLETEAVLVSHRPRWEFVKLRWLKADALPTIFSGSMPVLRHLDLAFQTIPTTLMDPFNFGDLPLLCSVTLDSLFEGVGLPWAQLTTLKLLEVYTFECTPILQQSVSLIHCELALYSTNHDDSRQHDITFPHLQTLICSVQDGIPMSGYIESFIVPALQSLRVTEAMLGSTPIHSISAFISKSGCTLQELHISGIGSSSYREAFRFIPRLTFDFEPIEDGSDLDEDDFETESSSDTESESSSHVLCDFPASSHSLCVVHQVQFVTIQLSCQFHSSCRSGSSGCPFEFGFGFLAPSYLLSTQPGFCLPLVRPICAMIQRIMAELLSFKILMQECSMDVYCAMRV
ncbi:hypothetical protein C8R43DRAFT_1068483 [Mycena crocata]|nr:hypothetical protein C8R43DRAFT_1068483 [Mycena crocata]